MRLISIGTHGYRRFVERNEMNVDGRVVAIVGPNEAGKTSLLNALRHLNVSGDFSQGELSRGTDPPDGPIVWARFLLEDEDREALNQLPGTENVRWFVSAKYLDGERRGWIEPTLRRDLRPRVRMVKLLTRAARHTLVDSAPTPEGLPTLREALASLAENLSSDAETLPGIAEELRSVASRLASELPGQGPKYVRELPERLEKLAAHEEAERPHSWAVQQLYKRQPEFLFFGNEERSLQSDYDIVAVADDPPVALRNLLQLAGFDLSRVRDAIAEEDFGLAEHLEEQANKRLKSIFEDAWRQSGVTVRLRIDGSILRVLVSATAGGYTTMSERSDGLRWFISLLTYTALNPSDVKPILLVDEAESHLHYDAQADLIRVFSQQRSAVKVIYTTHSAGCLPQDLGTGVRVVVPTDDGTSKLRNHFWTEGPGFSPLITAMGASVLALIPTRFAVIGEGPSEVIMLPSLLREVSGQEDLGFQIAPGLAEVRPSAVTGLDLEGARVAYVVDGDKGGRAIRKKLEKGKVPTDLIVTLGGPSSKAVLEDMLKKEVYLQAVNLELARSHGKEVQIPPQVLPNLGRPAAIGVWCSEKGIEAPNKTAVSYRILELCSEGVEVVASNRSEALLRTYRALAKALKLDPDAK
jgi:hypothetical protein